MRKLEWNRLAEIAIVAIMFVSFFYGIIRFPDGPLHPCATGYCGKQGQFRTASDYSHYELWSHSILIIWPAGMLGLWLLRRGQRNKG